MTPSELPGSQSSPDLPTDFPAPALLAKLANDFFQALPASAPAAAARVPENPQPAGLTLPPGSSGPSTVAAVPFGAYPVGANLLPTSPRAPLDTGLRMPARAPHAPAANGAPDIAITAAPGYDGRAGSQFLAVPQLSAVPHAGAAAVPTAPPPINTAGSALPATPDFYFLPAAGGAAAPVAPAAPDSVDSAARAPSFYFLETSLVPARGVAVPRADHGAHPPFDVNAIRRDFPILQEQVNGRPLVWFDNAATTQKPQVVIDRLAHFYRHENSNIHRAAHELAARATDAYEQARETVRRFLGAASTEEIVFVRGATEAVNLVAKSWGARHIGPGDEIIVSHLEHHANIVPWQQLASEKGARIRVIPVDDSGQVLLEEYQRLLNDRTKLVAVTQVSNALGTVVPVQKIVELAHRAGACALVDGAQSVSHMRVDMRALDADFFVFSGHKIFGPTGIGVLYGKRALLEDMPPWQGGGNMIADVTFERTVYQAPPARFEAGTGNIADAVGLGAALEYVERIGIENIGRYEHALLEYATQHLRAIPGLRLIGTAADKASVLSFVLEGSTTEEVGSALNAEGIAVRSGHHCAQPILRRFGLETTVRPSLAFYNTCEEVDRMVAVIDRLAVRSARPA
jgi:cysteine desulfurase/selenocysteine lyase